VIDGLEAITFDFGNTLVPFPAAPMAQVVEMTADRATALLGCPRGDFVRFWGEERLRQFAEDVPEGREADMDVRLVRVLARLRRCDVPQAGERWDDVVAATYSSDAEVAALLSAYADAFVETTPVPAGVGAMLERLAGRYRVGLISNWPLALSVERFLEAAGWRQHLGAVAISHRVRSIKPHAAIFEAAAEELGVASGPGILHVGDDLGADVAGAQALGWRTALVLVKPEDSSLPLAAPVAGAKPDLEIRTVLDLEAALIGPGRPGTRSGLD
jgi:FMN phosphatase YigB (HAD superfamily)